MKTSLFVIVAGAALLGASGIVLAQSSTRSIWDGAYTTAQAARGKVAYGDNSRPLPRLVAGRAMTRSSPSGQARIWMVDFDGQTDGRSGAPQSGPPCRWTIPARSSMAKVH